MKKEKIILDDGRYLIYYKFGRAKAKITATETRAKTKEANASVRA